LSPLRGFLRAAFYPAPSRRQMYLRPTIQYIHIYDTVRNTFHTKLAPIKAASRTTLTRSRMRQWRFVLLADRVRCVWVAVVLFVCTLAFVATDFEPPRGIY